jgi:hypothetical protein
LSPQHRDVLLLLLSCVLACVHDSRVNHHSLLNGHHGHITASTEEFMLMNCIKKVSK